MTFVSSHVYFKFLAGSSRVLHAWVSRSVSLVIMGFLVVKIESEIHSWSHRIEVGLTPYETNTEDISTLQQIEGKKMSFCTWIGITSSIPSGIYCAIANEFTHELARGKSELEYFQSKIKWQIMLLCFNLSLTVWITKLTFHKQRANLYGNYDLYNLNESILIWVFSRRLARFEREGSFYFFGT